MRRKEREVTAKAEISAILDQAQVCHLALAEQGQPYVLPLNFGYIWQESLKLYFHCAHEGRKLGILAQNNKAAFVVDGEHQLLSGPRGCHFSYAYASVMGEGEVAVVTENTEKQLALQALMRQLTGRADYSFTEQEAASVTILRLDVAEISGKRNPAE